MTNPVNPGIAPIDVAEAGRVMATLDDWRALFFVMVLLFIVMVLERALSAYGMRQERKDMKAEREKMWEVADKFGEAANKISDATDGVIIELQVLRALTARVEATASRTARRSKREAEPGTGHD